MNSRLVPGPTFICKYPPVTPSRPRLLIVDDEELVRRICLSFFRAENFDWPRQGGAPGGDLMEQVSFTNLRWNNGLTDREFNK